MEDLLVVRPVAQGRLSEVRPGVPDCPEETVTLLRPLREGVTLTVLMTSLIFAFVPWKADLPRQTCPFLRNIPQV